MQQLPDIPTESEIVQAQMILLKCNALADLRAAHVVLGSIILSIEGRHPELNVLNVLATFEHLWNRAINQINQCGHLADCEGAA